MDPIKDAKLMWIAEEGLVAPLPDPWEFFTNNQGHVLYRNTQTDEIINDHPNDIIYRQKYLEERRKMDIELA